MYAKTGEGYQHIFGNTDYTAEEVCFDWKKVTAYQKNEIARPNQTLLNMNSKYGLIKQNVKEFLEMQMKIKQSTKGFASSKLDGMFGNIAFFNPAANLDFSADGMKGLMSFGETFKSNPFSFFDNLDLDPQF